ncbi:MAG TPA: hypothetical protein VEP89_09660, partial [Draconibacterium sp.]|nr:hypothetical protein [Draconibacterium sp.]
MRKSTLLIISVACIIWSCSTNQNTKQILKLAGPNRAELENILQQYAKDESDSIHLEAARYLINNMPGHYAYDTTDLSKYRPVVEKIVELRSAGVSVNNIKEQVNPLMDELDSKYPLSQFYSNTQNDLNYISAEILKGHIELAVNQYNQNPFKDSIAFEDFLEYVLPYRILDGKSAEDWRSYFIQNHAEYLDQDYKTLHELCDSLLYNYHKIEIGWDIATRFPYVKLEDYLKSRMALCPEKTWFNCMLLRSFGIPATIDYNPVSRLHEVGHEWNAIKLKSGTHPFEAFWGGGNIWHLKKLYGRESMHDMLGIVEFPKIYRKTYKMNVTELLEHKIKIDEEIPPFFQNPFQLDVSEEYFKTYPVESPVLKEIEDHDYVYACVMGANLAWVPVEFGKIKRGKTSFRNMGSNNVYLTCNYQFGSIVPAAYPVFLNDDGENVILKPDTARRIALHAAHVAYPEPWIAVLQECLVGARVEVSNDKDFKNYKVLYEITEPYDLYPNYVSLPDD